MKKNKILGLLVFMFILSFSQVFADEAQSTLQSGWDTGIGVLHFNYEEPSVDVRESGVMYGIQGSYTAFPNDDWMWRMGGSFHTGRLKYDGATWAGTPVSANTEDYIYELRGLLGKNINHSKDSRGTFFVGFGHRYWNDRVKATGGYEREITYFYVPLGYETARLLKGSKMDGFKFELDWLIRGKVRSHLSNVDPRFNDPSVTQNSGYGFRVAYYFKNIGKMHNFSLEPYVQYWSVKDSKTAILTLSGLPFATVLEPRNRTTVYGLNASWGW